MSGFKLGARSIERAKGVNQLLLDCVNRSLMISKYDMTVPQFGGVRTADEQNELFKKGVSKADGINKLSYHQSGNAIDLIPVDGLYENIEGFKHFASIMKIEWSKMKTGKKLVWGGDWKTFLDLPHWEVK